MRRRELRVTLALAIATLGSIAMAGLAEAHNGSPKFRSTVRRVTPAEPGVQAQVLNYDDRLQLINRSGTTVVVRGYGGEPYIRVRGDGTVEVNKNSPSFYLNQDRYANVNVPSTAKKDAHPAWNVVDKTGRYEWHDHRIHYMAKGVPPQVTDRNKRTRIFNWQVRIDVGGKPATLRGDLFWQPPAGGLPRAAMLAFAGLIFGSVFVVEVVRRRRQRHGRSPKRPTEAWG